MRTTLTLEKDVAASLERLRKARRVSMKALINDALREGLRSLAAPSRRTAKFETQAVDLGRCLVGDLDDIAEAIAGAENESFR
jgi:hypothetical protein